MAITREFREDVMLIRDYYDHINDYKSPYQKENVDFFYELKRNFLDKYKIDDPNPEVRRVRKIILSWNFNIIAIIKFNKL